MAGYAAGAGGEYTRRMRTSSRPARSSAPAPRISTAEKTHNEIEALESQIQKLKLSTVGEQMLWKLLYADLSLELLQGTLIGEDKNEVNGVYDFVKLDFAQLKQDLDVQIVAKLTIALSALNKLIVKYANISNPNTKQQEVLVTLNQLTSILESQQDLTVPQYEHMSNKGGLKYKKLNYLICTNKYRKIVKKCYQLALLLPSDNQWTCEIIKHSEKIPDVGIIHYFISLKLTKGEQVIKFIERDIDSFLELPLGGSIIINGTTFTKNNTE